MVKKLFYTICCFVLLGLSGFSQQTFQIDTTFEASGYVYNQSLSLRIPKDVIEVKGLLIKGNSGGGTTLDYVEDELANEFAKSINFAIMGTYNWGSFAADGEIELFDACIEKFAQMSGYPELIDAPVLFFGNSNGGMMAHSYNTLHPEKCIANLVNKGRNYLNPLPEVAALKTPGILVIGEFDLTGIEEHTNALFYNNRPRGALWSHIIYQGQGHTLIEETINLFYIMASEAIKLRYPVDQSPANGPVTLLDIDEETGWLSDSTTWKKGIIDMYDFNNYPNFIDSSSWHINKDLAYLFAAHSSYNRIDNNAYFSTTVADSGSIATFHFEVDESWDSIHVFNKSSIIGSYYSLGSTTFDFDVNLVSPGFYSCFAKVYLSSGQSSITNFDAVFVRKKEEQIQNLFDINKNIPKVDFYPNPCADKGYLVSDKQIESYILYSIDGKTILQKQQVNSNKVEISLSFLDEGYYLLKTIFDNNQFEVIKLIK